MEIKKRNKLHFLLLVTFWGISSTINADSINNIGTKMTDSISTKIYFQAINFNTAYGKYDPERLASVREYDEGEYNYELSNDYFENVKFYTTKDLDLVRFQIFFTEHAFFRYTEMYKDPQSIQDYYERTYETPFFKSLSNGDLAKKYHPSFQLGEFLTFPDFKSIILPNLKIDLIKVVKTEDINQSGCYVYYNWDFFEEMQISEYSNSLLRFMETLPYQARKIVFESKEDAIKSAFSALLENSCSNPDTRLRGLYFDIKSMGAPIWHSETYGSETWVRASIRYLNELGENKNNLETLEESLELISKFTISPFEVIIK